MLFFALSACTAPDNTDTVDTSDTAAVAENGLPEGESTWTGTVELSGTDYALDVVLRNTEGDLEGDATLVIDGFGEVTQSMTGTHEPVGGLVALAPGAWEGEVGLEVLGVMGRFDPVARTLTGNAVDYASASDNSLTAGPFSLTLVEGAGAATSVGSLAQQVPVGPASYAGTMQCTGPVREVAGQLDFDGEGGVVGDITVGDTGLDTPFGTFDITGVHNPSTGGITLVPGIWRDPAPSVLTFFVDATLSAATGSMEGDQRTNTSVCAPGTWSVTLDLSD